MRRCLRSLACVCLLALGLGAQAQTSPARAEELLRASGLWAELAAIVPPGGSRLAEQVMRLSGGAADARQLERAQRAFDTAFEAGRLRAQVLAQAASRLQPDQVEAAIAWYRSDLGREVLLLEEVARRQADAQRLLVHGLGLLAGASAERRSLLLEITAASGHAKLNARIQAGMGLAVQAGRQGAGAALPPVALQAQAAQLEALALGQVLAHRAAAFAPLPDAQLRGYLAFLQSPAGQAVQAGLNDAMAAAVFAQCVAWGQSLEPLPDPAPAPTRREMRL